MMLKIILNVELTLAAPFLTKSTDVGTFGIDAPFARSVDDEFQFPRKLIKGCLRQALTELSEVNSTFVNETQINKWLGKKSKYENEEDSTSVEPVRGKLFFSDFITENKGEKKTTTKISIDAARGAVKENHLLVIESPFKPQEKVKFTGSVTFFAADENEYHQVKKWISKGLNWITNLGALENINFGQLGTVIVSDKSKQEIQPSAQSSNGAETFALILKPEEPFCISKRRTTENLFESEEFIPGGAIKGCIAETLKLIADNTAQFTDLKANLHLIRFTHAFPAKTRVRPTVAPLSLVKISQPAFYDVAAFEQPILIGTPPQSPAFSVDWKKSDDVDAVFGCEHPNTVLSVQTAIENNKAKESQLFAYEKINPEGFEWLGKADLSKITDENKRRAVEQQLRSVFEQNLFGLGKTKAECKVEMLEETLISDKQKSNRNPLDNKFIITLQTPFLLCDPKDLNESSGKDDLLNKYKETWNQISEGSLELNHFFASQSLAGGEYLYKRFQSNNSYNPFLLTDAGSVFIFNITDETKAKEKIEVWLKQGLPLPNWAITLYGNDWQTCPYLSENGFGEITVNLGIHWNEAHKPTEVTVI